MLTTHEAAVQHDRLVQMLRDQQEMYEPTIFEFVVMTRREKIRMSTGTRIDSFVKIEGGEGVFIGRYVHVASFAHLNIGGGQLYIGNYAAVASGVKIISGSNQLDAMSMSACAPTDIQRVSKSSVVLHPYSVALADSMILPGVTLGEGAVLAAKALATKDVPPWEVWAGVPARFMKKREVVRK